MQSVNLNPGFLRIAKFILSFMVFSHWCACAWFFVALVEDLAPYTWVGRYDLVDEDTWTHYLSSLYWTWSTLTTLGYGDITAGTNSERICTMVCMLFGVSFYSYITASMSSFLDRLDASSQRRREQYEELEQYLKARKLSRPLQARIRDYFFTLWQQQHTAFNEQAILSRMSAVLQSEVVQEVYKDIIPKFPLLRHKDPYFVTKIVRRFFPVQYRAGKVVAREGTTAQDMSFIFRGRVEMYGASTGTRFLQVRARSPLAALHRASEASHPPRPSRTAAARLLLWGGAAPADQQVHRIVPHALLLRVLRGASVRGARSKWSSGHRGRGADRPLRSAQSIVRRSAHALSRRGT